MKQIKPLLIVCWCLICGGFTHAQDLMYIKKVKTPAQVKVYEIGLTEVKYKPWADTTMPMLVAPRESIKMLVLQNGTVFDFKVSPLADPSLYTDQHNSAIKFHFLSPLFSHLALSYEACLKPGSAYEVGLGLIGAGIDYGRNSRGVYVRLGYKFINEPDIKVKGMKYDHILKGSYIKPEVIFGGYQINQPFYNNSIKRRDVICGAVMMNFGNQWVMDNQYLFDLYFGFGYGFSAYEKTDFPGFRGNNQDAEWYHYAFVRGGKEYPIALSAGFKVGYLFGKLPVPAQQAK